MLLIVFPVTLVLVGGIYGEGDRCGRKREVQKEWAGVEKVKFGKVKVKVVGEVCERTSGVGVVGRGAHEAVGWLEWILT